MVYYRTHFSSTRLNNKMRMEVDVLDYIIERVLLMDCSNER